MNVDEARALLNAAGGADDPVLLPLEVLGRLSQADVADDVRFQVGTERGGIIELDWQGSFWVEDGTVFGEADHSWPRKYWYSPLGLEQYLDLVERAAERRQRIRGDVVLVDSDDDGSTVELRFVAVSSEVRLDRAYAEIKRIDREVTEAACHAADEVGTRIAEVAARLSGWGDASLQALVDAVEAATKPNEKGRALEELCARLFASIPGLSVKQRLLTETEEIDIVVLNDSRDPRFAREGPVFLVECKNWTKRCGKNDYVQFRAKIANRFQRCRLGFLVSWNGFAATVKQEMLRDSREAILIVPVTGADIRAAVFGGDFGALLARLWDEAIAT